MLLVRLASPAAPVVFRLTAPVSALLAFVSVIVPPASVVVSVEAPPTVRTAVSLIEPLDVAPKAPPTVKALKTMSPAPRLAKPALPSIPNPRLSSRSEPRRPPSAMWSPARFAVSHCPRSSASPRRSADWFESRDRSSPQLSKR
jgi:hypothetical protein